MSSFGYDISQPAVERLVEEIRRYLDAVETFRREGYEPRWRSGRPRPVSS